MTDSEDFDAIVVGAGLTGAWSAREFARAGLRVAVLDAGPALDSALFESAGSAANPTSMSRQLHRLRLLARGEFKKAFNPPLQKETHSYFLSEHEHPYVCSGGAFNWSRVHVIGGRGHFWGRVLLRFTDAEFQSNWPLRYDDLAPCYDEVEALLRLGGAPSEHPGVPDGSYQTPRAFSGYEREFCDAVKARWPDRKAVVNHVAEYRPGPLSPMLEEGMQTGNLTLLPGKIVLAVYPKGRRDVEVHVHDKASGANSVMRAATVSLAASAFETVRILLNSKSDRHPNGLGNGSGLLGTSILEHLYVGTYSNLTSREDLDEENLFSPFWLNREPTGFYIPPVLNQRSRHAETDYGVQGVISDKSGMLYIGAFGRIAPSPSNRLTLDDARTDRLGRPQPVIHFDLEDADRQLFSRMSRDLEEMRDAFFDRIDQRPTTPLSLRLRNLFDRSADKIAVGSNHESGGAAMGSDPGASVTTPEGCLWEAENVLICDSACFPSLPPQNPTLTSMALALRSSRILARRL
jgi:choline dehydrogenase-like flavoprotein